MTIRIPIKTKVHSSVLTYSMLYPTHLLFGAIIGKYVSYSIFLVIAGAAIPDLIDKPLPSLGVVSTYQSIAHSIAPSFLIILLGLKFNIAAAIGIGLVSHLFLDALNMVINGRPKHTKFLLWPVASADDPLRKPPKEFFYYYIGSRSSYIEIVIFCVFIYLFIPEIKSLVKTFI